MDTTLATTPSSGTWTLIFTLLGLLIPVLSAYITKWVMNLLKSTSAWVDNLGATPKQIIVLVISAVLTLLFNFFGIALTGTATLTGLNAPDIQALISAALAMLFHNGQKLTALQTGARNFSSRGRATHPDESDPGYKTQSYRGKTNHPPLTEEKE